MHLHNLVLQTNAYLFLPPREVKGVLTDPLAVGTWSPSSSPNNQDVSLVTRRWAVSEDSVVVVHFRLAVTADGLIPTVTFVAKSVLPSLTVGHIEAMIRMVYCVTHLDELVHPPIELLGPQEMVGIIPCEHPLMLFASQGASPPTPESPPTSSPSVRTFCSHGIVGDR